ncbi:blue-light-activated protein [bacterium BMS3Bbin05]|nr:blue-light-activated protein [bacterium BMS3Bbin05]
MVEKSVQKRVRQSIIIYSALAILAIGLIVSLVSILPLYARLKEGLQNNLSYAVQIEAMAVDEYLSRAKDIALQITSRTQIRKKLEAYNRGEVSLKELVKYTRGKLSDAMKLSDEVVGITRLGPTDKLLVEVGLPLPGRDLWPIPPVNSRDVVIHGPVSTGKKSYLLVGVHIIGEKNVQAGTDIIVFSIDRLRHIVEDYPGLGKTGETIIGVPRGKRIELFFPLRKSGSGAVKTIPRDSCLGFAIEKSFQKKTAITISKNKDGNSVITAYCPVKGAQWGIAVKMDAEELYSPVNRQIILISSIIIALILFGTFGIVLLLRPLTGALQKELTEREQAEDALRKSETQYRGIFNSASDAFLIMNLRGKIVEANPQASKMYGYSHEELIGLHAGKLIHPDYQHIFEQFKEDLQTSGEFYAESINIHKDGSPIDVEIRGTVFDFKGKKHLLAISRDITGRNQAEEEKRRLQHQLLQSRKMESVGRLAGGISHDFNNLLSAIIGYSEMAMEELPHNHPVREKIKIISEAGEKATALTRQLLAFSRKQVLELKAVNLNTIVRNMDRMLSVVVGEDVLLELHIKSPVRNVIADPGQIDQILMNLVVNARDAMPCGGSLIIETADADLDEEYAKSHEGARPGSYVMLSLTDTGEGMSREVQERIFEPFFTTKGLGKGTGLGLATVYGIVKQHNGYIWVYSEPGKGTMFKIYLPVAGGEVEEAGEKECPVVVRGTETVLVVDDEPTIRKLIADTLQPLGYRLLEASCGGEALQTGDTFEGKIDLLLTDVIMPGMNGHELADALKIKRPEIDVIFMSGYPDDVITYHGVLKRGETFIQKPLTPRRLALKIREVLDRK